MVSRERKSENPRGADKKGAYRSATTGRYVKRSAGEDPSARARDIRTRFREQSRRFSDSATVVREDRDAD